MKNMNTLICQGNEFVPGKIVCIGRNYVDHIAELGNEVPESPVIFVKPNSAISATLRAIHDEPLHYEAELCFRFQQGRFDAVAFGLDLTKRQLQNHLKTKGLPWERAKAFDGSAVFSNFVAIDHIDDALALELYINNELKQQGGVALMMHKPIEILAEIQAFMSLQDGDIVMTGTPKGVGQIHLGDEFRGLVLQGDRELLEAHWFAK